MSDTKLETQLVHAGEVEKRFGHAVTLPIFQSSTFEYTGQKGYDQVRYIRLSNTPNHEVLQQKLAAIENAQDAVVTASGMAAISAALLSVLKAGDHLLIQRQLYGGTYMLVTEDLPRWGITFDFIDSTRPETWKSQVRANTKAIYVESVSNPILEVIDLQAVVRFARDCHLTSIIDNTFLSPVNLRPMDWGFDLVVHSCTKYLNGHSDIVAGAVVGRSEKIREINHLLNHLGGCLDPHAAFLLHRGMKTLALRVRQQNQNALRLAEFLKTCAHVKRVFYPGLPDHRGHELTRQFLLGSGGVLSFEMESSQQVDVLISHLRFAISAPSLGGVETLITRPVLTSHSGIPPQVRAELGVSDELVRVAVGIEASEDLVSDFAQAFAKL